MERIISAPAGPPRTHVARHMHNIHNVMNTARDYGHEDETWDECFAALRALQADNLNTVNETAGRMYALLHHAAFHGKQKACEVLFDTFGADPSVKTRDGHTAAMVASSEGHLSLSDYLAGVQSHCEGVLHELMNLAKDNGKQKEPWLKIYTFLDKKHVVNQRLERTYSLFHHAAYWGNAHACYTLMGKFGADPTLVDKNGITPEQIAAGSGAKDAANLIASFAAGFVRVPQAAHGHSSERRGRRGVIASAAPPSNIVCTEGKFALHATTKKPTGFGDFTGFLAVKAEQEQGLTGSYTFNAATRQVSVDGTAVGNFFDAPIASTPFLDTATPQGALLPLRCIKVVASEIMEEIQNPANEDAFFVLPSQLNGAEYPSDQAIVTLIDQYKSDRTGGPRGQLAVHPAAGQFILDNASNNTNLEGINATDIWLEKARDSMKSDAAKDYLSPGGLCLENGYLSIPPCPRELWPEVIAGLQGSLHTMRVLGMEGVPATGLAPSHEASSSARHRVSLMYASAIPIDSYQNRMNSKLPQGWTRYVNKDRHYFYCNDTTGQKQWEHPNQASHDEQVELQMVIGRLNLIAQYYGALKVALQRAPAKPAKVFLMPLGGGVFCNPMDLIVGAMSKAVELLHAQGVDVVRDLNINVLAWKGNPSEAKNIGACLDKFGKLL